MQQLIYFFQKYRYFLFFLLLQSVALALTINSHSFHKSKFVNSANAVTGGFYNKVSSFSDYFSLSKKNTELVTENENLLNLLEKYRQLLDTVQETNIIDTTKYNQQYSYISGKIIKNQYANKDNTLLINRGLNDSIGQEMAVINSKGIIGITQSISSQYATVQSILNRSSSINARILNKSNHFGNLSWNGEDYNIVQLKDIPRQVVIQKGDTIITGGKSSIFPEGIPIGRVIDVKEGNSLTKVIHIKLFNDMSDLKNIYVIKNFHKKEIDSLINNANE